MSILNRFQRAESKKAYFPGCNCTYRKLACHLGRLADNLSEEDHHTLLFGENNTQDGFYS